jgi:hypothetical protein
VTLSLPPIAGAADAAKASAALMAAVSTGEVTPREAAEIGRSHYFGQFQTLCACCRASSFWAALLSTRPPSAPLPVVSGGGAFVRPLCACSESGQPSLNVATRGTPGSKRQTAPPPDLGRQRRIAEVEGG